MKSLNFLLGLTVGVLAGTAVAIVFAPASGRETKENIHHMSEQARHRAKELRAKGRNYIAEERAAFRVAIEAGKLAAEQKKAELKQEIMERTA